MKMDNVQEFHYFNSMPSSQTFMLYLNIIIKNSPNLPYCCETWVCSCLSRELTLFCAYFKCQSHHVSAHRRFLYRTLICFVSYLKSLFTCVRAKKYTCQIRVKLSDLENRGTAKEARKVIKVFWLKPLRKSMQYNGSINSNCNLPKTSLTKFETVSSSRLF
jgi:hypothetical protein